jgi:hypothetical protein
MNLFGTSELDWRRPDVTAIVQQRGLASIRPVDHSNHRSWLEAHGYRIIVVECVGGVAAVLDQFNALFCWEQQFGYRLSAGHGNLNAIRDGFEFEVSTEVGVVLELNGVDDLYREDPAWTSGLLSIASEHSMYHVAFGRRFFCLLVLEPESRFVGVPIDQVVVPLPHWDPSGRLPP